MGKKIHDLIPILSKITRLVAAIKSLRFALLLLSLYIAQMLPLFFLSYGFTLK